MTNRISWRSTRRFWPVFPSQPEIRTATNGHDAIALLENEPFALLLVDLNMPQMDGFQVLAIVRRRFPSLRTVVMTGASEDDLRRAPIASAWIFSREAKDGARDYLFRGLHREPA